jgi:hypothetical protein
MLTRSNLVERLEKMNDRICAASAVTVEFMSDFVSAACDRLPMLDRAGKAARIQGLVESGAWTDTALALVEIELPRWKLRRLVLDEGQWLCSLSKQVNLPRGLDDSVDAGHEVLPLAILSALLEARRSAIAAPQSSPTVPLVRSAPGVAPYPDNVFCVVACDNFN